MRLAALGYKTENSKDSMKVVLISDNGNYHKKVTVKLWLHILLPLVFIVTLIVVAVVVSSLSSRSSLLASKHDKNAFKNFNSVLHKLSVLDAEVQRLNTLSTFIASKSKVNIKDFDLNKSPARGGGVKAKDNYFGSAIVRQKDVKSSVKNIENSLESQKIKLNNIVTSIEIKEAEDDLAYYLSTPKPKYSNQFTSLKPSRNSLLKYDFATPLKKGYISSRFGKRRDPINGSARHHGGLDIAAKTGTKVYAIANGFVTFKGRKGAYGNLLEINHSASLKSRYAHLSAFSVKKGDLVKKGDVIGKVGSTGRVTGPHLHLEIKENNRVVNPQVYLDDALRQL